MSNTIHTQNNNLQNNNGFQRRDFLKYSSSALAWVYLGGCGNSGSTEVLGYPIDPDNIYTTLEHTVKLSQTIAPKIIPQDLQNISDYKASGYGVFEDGGPLSAVLRSDIMSSTYALPVENKQTRLVKFFSISDIHITDKESPSQLIYMQPANITGDEHGMSLEAQATSAYSPTMLYTTQVLDAAIQTVNALHKKDPIDFGISLGDTCNSTQYNETRWYIDVIDGQVITPSSGINVGSETIDYQKSFKAAGLDLDIPWYQAIGNHDHFWLGSIPLDVPIPEIDLRASYVSDEVIAMPDTLARAANVFDMTDPLYYMGVLDGSTVTGEIIKAGEVGTPGFTTPPNVIADIKRRSLTKAEWAQEFFTTTTKPSGHGLNLVPDGKPADFACYSFLPKSELPLKIIVLDNTQSEEDGDPSIHGRGFLDEARWAWLKDELQKGTDAGQLMIIAAHVPIGVSPHEAENSGSDTYLDWYENIRGGTMNNAVTLPNLIAELHNHPNLLMWMAGHRHVNIVKAFLTDNSTEPERGFWHVETSSLHDFPQQLRLFEVSLNSDYTISISATNVDPAVAEGTPAYTAREYAVAAQQIVNNQLSPNLKGADPTVPGFPNVEDPSIKEMDPNICSYNAELLKQLSPEMIVKMQSLFPAV